MAYCLFKQAGHSEIFLQNIAKIVITWTEEKVMLDGPLKHVF